MRVNKSLIQVFEHTWLKVDDEFKESHFKSLVQYNESHESKYFSVGLNRIYFKSWVGVIQVDDLTIEILPKADRDTSESDNQKNKWHKVLLQMLREARYLKLESITEAHLELRNCTLLDLYFLSFIQEVEYLVHCGLVKKYRKEQGQVKSLKGRLMFQQQVTRNAIHKERFYTEHIQYDRDHLLNQILKRALEILTQVNRKDMLMLRTSKLLLDFEAVSYYSPNLQDFERIRLDRKTEPYRKAILLAKMIILNYSPDLKGGNNHILALMFDMNRLFEAYVFRALKQAASKRTDLQISLHPQQRRAFWREKVIKPDIVVNISKEDAEQLETLIIDAKWKVLSKPTPSDEDLKQMFTYNMHFNSQRSILLYPEVRYKTTESTSFKVADAASGFSHSCQLAFAPVANPDGTLNREFGTTFFNAILGEPQN